MLTGLGLHEEASKSLATGTDTLHPHSHSLWLLRIKDWWEREEEGEGGEGEGGEGEGKETSKLVKLRVCVLRPLIKCQKR